MSGNRKTNFCVLCTTIRPYNAKRYCIDCAKQQHLEVMRQYRSRNRHHINALRRAYVKRNPERTATATKKWATLNKVYRVAAAAKREAGRINATPAWANHFFINEAYSLARLRTKLTGVKWQVDHVVPLRSKLVCGLHVEHNLAVITAFDNLSKRNFVWPDI